MLHGIQQAKYSAIAGRREVIVQRLIVEILIARPEGETNSEASLTLIDLARELARRKDFTNVIVSRPSGSMARLQMPEKRKLKP